MLARMWWEENPRTLLVGMETDAATVWSSTEISHLPTYLTFESFDIKWHPSLPVPACHHHLWAPVHQQNMWKLNQVVSQILFPLLENITRASVLQEVDAKFLCTILTQTRLTFASGLLHLHMASFQYTHG